MQEPEHRAVLERVVYVIASCARRSPDPGVFAEVRGTGWYVPVRTDEGSGTTIVDAPMRSPLTRLSDTSRPEVADLLRHVGLGWNAEVSVIGSGWSSGIVGWGIDERQAAARLVTMTPPLPSGRLAAQITRRTAARRLSRRSPDGYELSFPTDSASSTEWLFWWGDRGRGYLKVEGGQARRVWMMDALTQLKQDHHAAVMDAVDRGSGQSLQLRGVAGAARATHVISPAGS